MDAATIEVEGSYYGNDHHYATLTSGDVAFMAKGKPTDDDHSYGPHVLTRDEARALLYEISTDKGGDVDIGQHTYEVNSNGHFDSDGCNVRTKSDDGEKHPDYGLYINSEGLENALNSRGSEPPIELRDALIDEFGGRDGHNGVWIGEDVNTDMLDVLSFVRGRGERDAIDEINKSAKDEYAFYVKLD